MYHYQGIVFLAFDTLVTSIFLLIVLGCILFQVPRSSNTVYCKHYKFDTLMILIHLKL